MSLLSRANQSLRKNDKLPTKQLHIDIKENDIVSQLSGKSLKEKLIKLNEINEFLPYYFKKLFIKLEYEEVISIIFSNKLTNLYPLIQEKYKLWDDGCQLMLYASQFGEVEMLKYAIEIGGDEFCQSGLWATLFGHIDILKTILEFRKKTAPNRMFGYITTWFQGAVQIGNLEIFKYLIDENALTYEMSIENANIHTLIRRFQGWHNNYSIPLTLNRPVRFTDDFFKLA